MTHLAMRMLRRRPGSALATLIALAAGVMILTAMGILIESGVRYHPAPQRYAAADIVVARTDMTVSGKELDGTRYTTAVRLPDGGTVPAATVEQLRRTPGVAAAVADYSFPVTPLTSSPVTAVGHGWGSAGLTPYRITAGNPPASDTDIVVDAGLAASAGDALRPGRWTEILIGGIAHRYRVSGVAGQSGPAGQAAVFFTDARAATLTPHPGRVDAVGVVAAPGADRAAVTAAVTRVADGAGAQTYAGADRGLVEQTQATSARALLVQAGAAFGGYVVLLIVFVVAGTVGLSVRHRRRDIALLRAIAATPGQVRRMLMAEAALVGGVAAVLGVPAGLVASRWVGDQLVSRAFIPADLPVVAGVVSAPAAVLTTVLVAVLSALVAARRATAIRPTDALGEAAVEPVESGRVRLGIGLATLAGAVSSSIVTVSAGGQGAMAAAIGMLYLFVAAVALLAPWINRGAARLLAPVLRAVWGSSGFLATANLRANARGMATVLTALVLAVGFGGSVWFLQDNLLRSTVSQSRDGMLAQRVLTAPAGLPDTAVDEVRRVAGVQAVTAVRRTAVVVRALDGAETVSARAIDPADAAATTDLRVVDGDLADLRADAIAVSAVRASAQGWETGERVELWLGDGTPVTVRIAAIYERGLGFGDVVLSRDTVAAGPVDQVLIRTGPDAGPGVDAALDRVAAHHPTSTVIATDDLTGELATDLAVSAWLNKLLIGVMVGYAALAAANTMVMAALARRRELALLRLVGVTRRQARRMVYAEQAVLLGVAVTLGATIAAATLAAVVNALTGSPLPYVPPLGWVAVLGGTALLALTTTMLPIGRLLRTPPVEHVGLKE